MCRMASPAEEAAAEVDGEGGGSEAAETFQQAMLQQMRRMLRQHEQAVQERLRQLDERLRALEERVGATSASGEHAASGRGLPVTVGEVAQEASATAITEAEGDDGQAQQEPVSPGVAERLSKLEAAVATALHTMFPRVEALLSQLERDSVGRACDGEDVADPAPAPAPAPAAPAPAVAVRDPAAQLLWRQLLEAMKDGIPERVRELLDAGADPNFRRGDGWTPLMVGARYNRNQALLLLLKRGADPCARDCLGTCALHLAVCEERTGETVRLLVGGGADPNCADRSGQTPLHCAARWGSAPAARALLAAGARADAVDTHGRTPRRIAWTQEVLRLFDGEQS